MGSCGLQRLRLGIADEWQEPAQRQNKGQSAPSLIGLCDIESTDTAARLQRAASDTVQRPQPAPNEEPR